MEENQIFKNLKTEIQNIKINADEKAVILERVTNTPLLSSYAPVRSVWVFRARTLVYVVASLLVVVLGGSGVAYASLHSVPGESLYVVKIKVTEPVLDALAFTPVARAERQAQKVVRRLNEAEKLILKGGFTVEHKIELEKKFNKNAEDFNIAVELIEKESLGKKEELKASLEVSLNTHLDTIQKISIEKSAVAEVIVDKEKNKDTKDTKESEDAKIDIEVDEKVSKESSLSIEAKAVSEVKKEEIGNTEKSQIISEFEKVVKDRILLNKSIDIEKEVNTEEKEDTTLDTKIEDSKNAEIIFKEETKVETKIDNEIPIVEDKDPVILPPIPQSSILKVN